MASLHNNFREKNELIPSASLEGRYEFISPKYISMILSGYSDITTPDIIVSVFQTNHANKTEIEDKFNWVSRSFIRKIFIQSSYVKIKITNNASSGNVRVNFNLHYKTEGELNNTSEGTHGNLWDNEAIANNTDSNFIDVSKAESIDIYGNSDAKTDLTILYCQGNPNLSSHWYKTNYIITIPENGSDFHSKINTSTRFIKLNSSLATTITATCSFR